MTLQRGEDLVDQAVLPISKFDAARRQLETAVRLYFSHGDPVSIHTLASAALQILTDLSQNLGTKPETLRGVLMQYIRKEHLDEIERKLAESENFFKHADRDPAKTLEFAVGQSEIVLLDAIAIYAHLTSEQVPLFIVYRAWFLLEAGKEFAAKEEYEAVLRTLRADFKLSSRERFFSEMLPVAASLGVQPSG